MIIFDHAIQNSLNQLLAFQNLHQHAKQNKTKKSLFHQLIFKIQSILESRDQTDNTKF